ncbi:MAG TPA: hypothetical protein PKD55_00010 [Bellilinea sp.]|nr:hypothetical protein [Bellilinea sp.]
MLGLNEPSKVKIASRWGRYLVLFYFPPLGLQDPGGWYHDQAFRSKQDAERYVLENYGHLPLVYETDSTR